MKVGEVLESPGIWLDGTETQEQLHHWKTSVIGNEVTELTEERLGVVLGPWEFKEYTPLDDRVPPVPDHIKGPNVRLLVGETQVMGHKPQPAQKDSRFIWELDSKDLERLRKITRKAFVKHEGRSPTQLEVDDIINRFGPESALATLRTETDD